jgi:hypothetical protein
VNGREGERGSSLEAVRGEMGVGVVRKGEMRGGEAVKGRPCVHVLLREGKAHPKR